MFKDLDIVLWKYRYPVILTNTMSIQVLMHLRLLLISDFYICLKDALISDVLRVMCIDQKEVYVLTADQINTLILPQGFTCHCWWIGTTVLFDFRGICLHTSSLLRLKNNVEDKRNLWYQIKKNMHILYV